MKKYLTINDLANDERYPLTLGTIRSLIRHRKTNGLIKAVVQIGRRVYIKAELFEEWLDSNIHSKLF